MGIPKKKREKYYQNISSILMFVLIDWQEEPITETNDEAIDGLSHKVSALYT